MELLMEKFEPYGKVIAPCLRGSGFSSYNNKINGLEDFANDLKLFMEEYSNSNNFYVVGHSMGGPIAL